MILKKLSELFNDGQKKKLKPLIALACICILALIAISVIPQNKKLKHLVRKVKKKI